jgi:hypothetical protein
MLRTQGVSGAADVPMHRMLRSCCCCPQKLLAGTLQRLQGGAIVAEGLKPITLQRMDCDTAQIWKCFKRNITITPRTACVVKLLYVWASKPHDIVWPIHMPATINSCHVSEALQHGQGPGGPHVCTHALQCFSCPSTRWKVTASSSQSVSTPTCRQVRHVSCAIAAHSALRRQPHPIMIIGMQQPQVAQVDTLTDTLDVV